MICLKDVYDMSKSFFKRVCVYIYIYIYIDMN